MIGHTRAAPSYSTDNTYSKAVFPRDTSETIFFTEHHIRRLIVTSLNSAK